MKKCNLCGFENEETAEICASCGAKLDEEVTEAAAEEATVVEEAEANETTVEEAIEVEEEAGDTQAENADEQMLEVAEGEEIIAEATEEVVAEAVKKPMSPAAKKSLGAVIIVLAAAIAFYLFGSLGLMSRIGIVNTGRYIKLVQNRQIQENENAPSVKLGSAFDKFFVNENNEPVSKWSVSKTDGGIEVKCETVCNFEGQENTVATYKVVYDYSNNIVNETFAAADATLDRAQTESVLKKTARYSDPAKTEYTTKELSSSKYNNMNYYFPQGMDLEMVASMMYQISLDEFLKKFYLPEDMEGSTDTAVAEYYFTLQSLAALSETTVEEIRKQLELDESVPETKLYTEITDEFPLTKYNITDENIAELREQFGFGEEVTPDTLYKDVKDRIVKFQYDQMEKQQKASEQPAEEQPAEEAPAENAENTEAPAENAEAAQN